MSTFSPPPARPVPARSLPVWRWLVAFFLVTAAAGCSSLPANTGRTPSQALATPDQTAIGQWIAQRRAQAAARSDSAFVLLDNADAALAGRLALIDVAQRTIDLQYYAIHADASSELILQHLRDAGQRGVRVRVLLDDLNTVGKDAQVLRLAFEPNVQMRLFNPLPGSRSSLIGHLFTSLKDVDRIQKRMHNKMFISDNAMAITGGRNLGDSYFGADENSNFVDVDVLAAGRVVRDMSSTFDRYWNDDLAFPVEKLITPEQLESMRKPASGTGPIAGAAAATVTRVADGRAAPASANPAAVMPDVTQAAVANATPGGKFDLHALNYVWSPAVLMADQPGKIAPDDDEVQAGETVVDGLLGLMKQARQDVLIVSPYFVPGPQMMKVFADMRRNNVRIRVLTNSLASNDAPAAHAGYARYRKDLVAMGIELYEMRADQHGSGGLAVSSGLAGSGGGSRSSGGSGSGFGLGSGGSLAGGSKSGDSKASLHSKIVIIDGRLAIIGSMNLDLRSQRQNSEVALLIRSAAISGQTTKAIEGTISKGAYRVGVLAGGDLVWRAPPGASFGDAHSEPEASAKQRMLVQIIAPFAPDEML